MLISCGLARRSAGVGLPPVCSELWRDWERGGSGKALCRAARWHSAESLVLPRGRAGREAQNVSAYRLIVGNEVIMIADLIDAFRPGRAVQGLQGFQNLGLRSRSPVDFVTGK